MSRKFYNNTHDVLLIVTDNDDGATTVIVGDESKITDAEIFSLYNGDRIVGWTRTA